MNGQLYKKSALKFSFALSLTYLPLELGISDVNKICNTLYCTHIIIFLVGTSIFTALNYFFLLKIKNIKIGILSPFMLIILNILILISLSSILPVRIEGNVFAFSIIFLFIPWLIILYISSKDI